jgi:hypothetical protein
MGMTQKKYKDMTPEERAALKAANEAATAKLEAGKAQPVKTEPVKDTDHFRNLAAAQARDAARNDAISGYTRMCGRGSRR